MGLANIVRNAVKIADNVTKDLQVDVTHEAWTGRDAYDVPEFDDAVTLKALVEPMHRQVRLSNGQDVIQRAKVTIIGPVEDNGGGTATDPRHEPIDPRDRITLPDGTTGPILSVNGLTDPSTNRPYLYEVALG